MRLRKSVTVREKENKCDRNRERERDSNSDRNRKSNRDGEWGTEIN